MNLTTLSPSLTKRRNISCLTLHWETITLKGRYQVNHVGVCNKMFSYTFEQKVMKHLRGIWLLQFLPAKMFCAFIDTCWEKVFYSLCPHWCCVLKHRLLLVLSRLLGHLFFFRSVIFCPAILFRLDWKLFISSTCERSE